MRYTNQTIDQESMDITKEIFTVKRGEWVKAVHDSISFAHLDSVYVEDLFDPDLDLGIPTGPGLYLWWDEDGELAYIGRGENLHRRISEHLDTDNPKSWAYGRYDGLESCEVGWLTGWDAWQSESDFIAVGQPLHNKNHRRISYPALV